MRGVENLVGDLKPVPVSSSGRQRLRQRLQHLQARLSNLARQVATLDAKAAVEVLSSSVVGALQSGTAVQIHTLGVVPAPSVVSDEAAQGPVAPLVAFSGCLVGKYHKLPNPFANIIQQLPVVDGLDEVRLIDFFRHILQLGDFP